MLPKSDTPQFSQSINIIRDADRDLIYFPTENAKRVYHQIINDYKLGNHVFNIIGSYGTGKSSFLWALEQNLIKRKPYFADNFENLKIDAVRIIGEYISFKDAVRNVTDIEAGSSSAEIFAKLFYEYKSSIQGGLLLIMVDEFGKFLEYASKNNPEKELYFLQEFAEFVNNPKYNIIFITTVHQNFDAYAFGLQQNQRMEWGKVKGRFKEITFNEPVEQLLQLASESLKQSGARKSADDEILAMNVAEIFNKSKAFAISKKFSSDIALDIMPLDLLAANVLTLSLQKYGQNERSLFSFLESSDHTSLNKVTRNSRFFNLAHVYDYLHFNFYSFIQSKYNPDYSSWIAIRNSIDQVQRRFEQNVEEGIKLVKAIGLLQLFAAQGSQLDNIFLINYSKLCLDIENPESAIDKLKSNKIIVYREHLQRYAINEGTSLDVEAALILAAAKVEQVQDVATLLKRYYSLPPVLAKSYTYECGTPRVFDFIITDKLKDDRSTDDLDGLIYLIFNEKLKIDEIVEHSKNTKNVPLIFVYYENSKSIKDLLFELEKLRKVKEDNSGDSVAVKLLNESLEASQKALNYFILGSLHSNAHNVKWVWDGKICTINNKRSFNQLLSIACSKAYPGTPIFKNELLNKHKISPSIATARKNYFKALVNSWNKIDLGFEKDKFPPEKTIFLSLVKENRISISTGSINLDNNQNNFSDLWNVSEGFLNSSQERKRELQHFTELLSKPPFKLKQGLISFWLPTFLFIKRDEFALFGEHGYIPFLTEETLDLIIRYPEKYEIKAFELTGIRLDIFNKYRTFLKQEAKDNLDNQTFIDTIRPFLTFYRQLPDFAKNTISNLGKDAIALRKVISNTEDLEKTFFDDFPSALGYSAPMLSNEPESVERYIFKLETTIREIRTCFELLISRFESHIQERIGAPTSDFSEYKTLLATRYRKIKSHLVQIDQKSFIQRVSSNIDDRKAWLNSISQNLIGKPFESFNDEDEFLLKDRFDSIIAELDSLTDLTSEDFDNHREDIIGFEINDFIDGVNKTIVRLPKNARRDIEKIENKIEKLIIDNGINNQLTIAALANVIKKLMKS